jgi:opacity protein-like surface antigen
VGIEAGVAKVRPSDIDETVEYRSTPAAPGDPATIFYDDVFSARYKRASDLGAVAGFDFGWFRIEGEVAHKRARIDHYTDDDITDQFLSELNGTINRPSAAPDPGAPGLAPLALADFQPSATLNVGSAMINALVDIKVLDRVNVYAGIGAGRSIVRGFNDHDSSSVGQRLAGVRYSISDHIDLGLKYRNFRTGVIKLNHDPIDYAGNPNDVGEGSAQTTNAAVIPDLEGQFRSKSLLVSLTYNLR